MKVFMMTIILILVSNLVCAQEMHVLSRHHLKAEKEAYEEMEEKARLADLRARYPFDVPGVSVVNGGRLLGSEIAILKIRTSGSGELSEKVDFNCDEPGLLDRIKIFHQKTMSKRSARAEAQEAAEKDLSEACRQIGGTLNVAEIHYKKVAETAHQSQKQDLLTIAAKVKLEATGTCDRIGE